MDARPPLTRPAPEAAFWALVTGARHAGRVAGTEQDPDGARFALGVLDFDLSAGAPHPPGYPVYVAAAKAVRALGLAEDPAVALGLVSALASAGLALAVFAVADRLAGRWAARGAAALLLASPLVGLFATRAMSDLPGAALAWGILALALAADAHRGQPGAGIPASAAAIAFGLLAGVRPSALPFALPALAVALRASPRPSVPLRALAAASLAWLLPFLAVTGPADAASLSARHVAGHFGRWGGSGLTVPDPLARASGILEGLWAHGLGGAWPGQPAAALLPSLALVALGIAGARAALRGPGGLPPSRPALLVAACALAYLAWIALAQNVTRQPRHVLPLVPVACVALAAAVLPLWQATRGRPVARLALPALLLAGWTVAFLGTARLAREQRLYAPPVARLAREVAALPDAPTLAVATRDHAAWLRLRAPGVAVRPVTDLAGARALARTHTGRVVVTGEVPGARDLPPGALLLALGSDRDVVFAAATARLYQLPADPPSVLAGGPGAP
ncbi:DUF2723 domain-containing protein [Myxococcota bacterium]|nr:DUF2723 domain-containing protein [Myxococcota bacterium]